MCGCMTWNINTYIHPTRISIYMSVSACSCFRSIFLEIRVYVRQHIITTSTNHNNNNSNSDKSNNNKSWYDKTFWCCLCCCCSLSQHCWAQMLPMLILSHSHSLSARTHCPIVRRACTYICMYVWISFEIININNLKMLFTTALNKKKKK